MWLRLSPQSVAGYSTSLFCFPRRAPLVFADDLGPRALRRNAGGRGHHETSPPPISSSGRGRYRSPGRVAHRLGARALPCAVSGRRIVRCLSSTLRSEAFSATKATTVYCAAAGDQGWSARWTLYRPIAPGGGRCIANAKRIMRNFRLGTLLRTQECVITF